MPSDCGIRRDCEGTNELGSPAPKQVAVCDLAGIVALLPNMSEARESPSAPTKAAQSSSATTAKATASVDVVKAKPVETAKELKAKFRLLEKGLANTYDRLAMTEKQIFDLERSYLEETRLYGNVLSGWDKYLDDKSKGILWQRAKRHGEAIATAAAAVAAVVAAAEEQEGGGGGEMTKCGQRTLNTCRMVETLNLSVVFLGFLSPCRRGFGRDVICADSRCLRSSARCAGDGLNRTLQ